MKTCVSAVKMLPQPRPLRTPGRPPSHSRAGALPGTHSTLWPAFPLAQGGTYETSGPLWNLRWPEWPRPLLDPHKFPMRTGSLPGSSLSLVPAHPECHCDTGYCPLLTESRPQASSSLQLELEFNYMVLFPLYRFLWVFHIYGKCY